LGFPVSLGKEDKLNRKEKEEVVSSLKQAFSRSKAAVITHYKGMTVAELNELRAALRDLGIEYKVVKNTLARIAADGTPVGVAKERFSGPVGVALGYEDPVKVAQGIVKFAGKNDKLVPMAAVVEGQLVEAGELKAIAALPPRDVLLSMIAGAMSAPLSKMAAAFQATISSLGYALRALEGKKQAA